MAVSQIIQDLGSVPNIIGSLGLSIASAQKALDADYLDGIERILAMAKSILGNGVSTPQAQAFLEDMLTKLAPSRYQFTETTLSVRMDLAQSLQFSGSVGLGFGVGALSINAAFTLGYSYDYQAAAQCQTVLHAYPSDPTVFNNLLSRAATIDNQALQLPPRSQVDQAIFDKNSTILQKLTGKPAQQITTIPPVITKVDPSTGKAGTTVTVTASGFQSDSKVDVFDNSTPPKKVAAGLTISNVTATTFQVTLQVTPPLPTGVYQLQIVLSDGTVSDDTKPASQFTVQ